MASVNIKNVAKKAGVSVATVSRVLSGYPHVSSEMRERVLRAAEQLNYRPDRIARSLRRRQTTLIGLVVSTIENVFFMEVARAAEKKAQEHGYNLIVCNTEEDPDQEATYLTILDQLLVAGVVLAPAPGDGRHIKRFVDQGLPIVLVNRRIKGLSCPSIVADDEEAAFQCVSRLIEEGRRRIAAITGLAGISTTEERLHGYHRALRHAGLPIDEQLEVTGHADLEGGYRAAYQLMQQSPRPDALFVFNNVMTQGAIMALQDLDIRWPDEVDVAGFGAFRAAKLYRPSLCLIAQPAREMGAMAVEMLIQQVESRSGSDQEPQHLVLHNRLVPRGEWLNERRLQSLIDGGPCV